MTFQSQFLRTLEERGFIHQQTDAEALDKLLAEGEKNSKPVVAYIGFDCTATSLHVGSLLQIMTLRWFQQCGHKPIVLLGGGTTKIGDPSGKDKSREMLDDAAIEANKQSIKQNFEPFLEFEDSFDSSTTNAVLLDNAEWLDNINYADFLRDVGRHFSVNRMLTMDSVKLRLERDSHLSFLEFNYMILQAYDFTVLNDKYSCRLQIGGSDQWGNIVQGTDLQMRIRFEEIRNNTRKAYEKKEEPIYSKVNSIDVKMPNTSDKNYIPIGALESIVNDIWLGEKNEKEVHGLTTPLITTASGVKMGKTAEGAMWLAAEMLSPYDYWQFWRNTEDADVGRFLKFFTELPMEHIAELEAMPGAEINDAKKILATEATAMLHGEKAAEDALRTAEDTFEKGKLGDDLPEVSVAKSELEAGIAAFKLLHQAGLASSGKEARNLIKGGGARVNDEKIDDEMQAINTADLTEHGVIKLSAGKKKHVLVRAA